MLAVPRVASLHPIIVSVADGDTSLRVTELHACHGDSTSVKNLDRRGARSHPKFAKRAIDPFKLSAPCSASLLRI
jgi:hypothetical protein